MQPITELPISDYGFHKLLQIGKVGAFPVNLAAILAEAEVVEVEAGFGLQAVFDFAFGDGVETAVTIQTARPRLDVVVEVVAVQHGRDLFCSIGGAQAVAVADQAAHEQPPVAAEHDAAFVVGDLGQFAVIQVGAGVEGVEAEQAQQAGQFAQVVVQDETRWDFQQRP